MRYFNPYIILWGYELPCALFDVRQLILVHPVCLGYFLAKAKTNGHENEILFVSNDVWISYSECGISLLCVKMRYFNPHIIMWGYELPCVLSDVRQLILVCPVCCVIWWKRRWIVMKTKFTMGISLKLPCLINVINGRAGDSSCPERFFFGFLIIALFFSHFQYLTLNYHDVNSFPVPCFPCLKVKWCPILA